MFWSYVQDGLDESELSLICESSRKILKINLFVIYSINMQSGILYFWCGGNILVGNTKSSESKAARQALEYGSQLLCEERLGNGGYHTGPFFPSCGVRGLGYIQK